jgi:hypothetical protein
MARLALIPPESQIPLALEPVDSPQPESAFRSEYLRMQISRRLTFEQVMADTALAICVRNLAEARARRGGAGRRI